MIILSSLVLKMMNWTALAGGKGLLKLNSAWFDHTQLMQWIRKVPYFSAGRAKPALPIALIAEWAIALFDHLHWNWAPRRLFDCGPAAIFTRFQFIYMLKAIQKQKNKNKNKERQSWVLNLVVESGGASGGNRFRSANLEIKSDAELDD